ncbi:hypothetical protein JG687_00017148, partial [Phytophthora cactorum]
LGDYDLSQCLVGVAAEQAAQGAGEAGCAADFEETAVALPIRQSSLSATSEEPATRAEICVCIVGHGGEAGVDVGAGYGGAIGQVTAAGRGVRGGRGGCTARQAASTASAKDEVDGSEFGDDVNMNVDGTSGQKFGSCRGGRGQAAVVPESPQPGSATPTGATASTTTPTRTPPIML